MSGFLTPNHVKYLIVLGCAVIAVILGGIYVFADEREARKANRKRGGRR